MRKSFPILIGLLLFWTGLSVGFADVISDAYNPVSETIRNPSNSDGYWNRTGPTIENTPMNVNETGEFRLWWDATNDNSLGWSPSGWPNDLMSTDFRLDPNGLSPSEKRYTGGTKVNLTNLLKTIGNILLIATSTIAVLSIVVGGVMIATTGPSDRAAKWKTIITLNIIAIFVALFSYSLIRLVSWIIAA